MESSFFEYRDATRVEDDSETEVIDDSFVEDKSFSTTKKQAFKNKTVFISESEESVSEDGTAEDNTRKYCLKSIRKSSVGRNGISSSEDETDKRASLRSPSGSSNKCDESSSEEEMSPEMVPRPRPNTRTPRRSSESFIGRRNKKRVMVVDSDTDNSFVVEHSKKNACLQKTPLRINGNVANATSDECGNIKFSNSINTNGKEIESYDENDHKAHDDNLHNEVVDKRKTDSKQTRFRTSNSSDEDLDSDKNIESDCVNSGDESDEVGSGRDDEDEMVMSRATRMSIMGFIPKETPSDDSDYIQSDNNSSRPGSSNSLAELPDFSASLRKSPVKSIDEGDDKKDSSTLTCSPFTSPLKDITNEFHESFKSDDRSRIGKLQEICDLTHNDVEVYDLTGDKRASLRDKVLRRIKRDDCSYKESVINDDVTIIDREPEVIALSSDDEEHVKEDKRSPNVKKAASKKSEGERSESATKVGGDMRRYLLPTSYPNQVVYVKKHVRENELRQLAGLQEDLHNVRSLLENMDVDTLPDGGVKLIERLTSLELAVRQQGDKVANMVVEPDVPTVEDIAKDGFESKGLSWDDIKKASEAVQPRMFGKQAMSTHVAERNLILERLRDLHESLASRPAEHELAAQPAALSTQLMPHQLHALTWLRWRETQRPPGGILADDMGLGKTITMISLVAGDKEAAEEDDDGRGKGGDRLVRGGTLVVCPASLVQQWAEEARRHCRPHRLSVCLHHGAARATQPRRLAHHDLVITTYNILQREAKNGALLQVQWRRCILDEAHAVRNHKTATASAVLPGRLRAHRRWALTGTPLHNKDLDLFALLRFLGCSPFDDLQKWKKWIDNKSTDGHERLGTIMRCIMLRRTKQQLQARGELACLPQRDQHEREITLTRDEMNVYQKLLVLSKTLFAQFLQQRAEQRHELDGKDTAYAEMHKRMVKLHGVKPVKSHEILVLLLRLRQVCCHCGLITGMLGDEPAADAADTADTDGAEQDLLDELNKLVLEDKESERKNKGIEKEEEQGEEEGSSAAEAVRSVLTRNNPVFCLDAPSSKISAVMDCLQEHVLLNRGEKAVVVSQWTGVLALVESELRRADVRCVTLSGAVPVNARAPLVQALNDPESPVRVMLLSLTAGGVGLNLCGANHLLLLDPHWNPQLEQQAQDRIYRVGQTRHVHIYRFMCVDTVEQSIRKLQCAKLALADSVLTGARATNAAKLSIEDLKMLFNMPT